MLSDRKYGPLRLSALNHVSRVCKDIQTSVDFYESVLDFVPIQRPSSFDFAGAWCVRRNKVLKTMSPTHAELAYRNQLPRRISLQGKHIF